MQLAVFGLTLFCYSAPYDPIKFLIYSKILRSMSTFESEYLKHEKRPFYPGWHNQEAHAVPKEDRLRFNVSVPEWWRDYKPLRVLEMRISPMFAFLGRQFVDGREPSSALNREHIHCVAYADYCDRTLMSFVIRLFLHVS